MSQSGGDDLTFTGLLDLASAQVGGSTLMASDDFFAAKENLLRPQAPTFDPDAYCDTGKVMDGWESRRRRSQGHDWCVIRLGARGVIRVVDIDTRYFLGNHPPYASLEACEFLGDPADFNMDQADWHQILPQSPLRAGSRNLFSVNDQRAWSHLRLCIYPDGGVARLRVYGEARPRWEALKEDEELDLACVVNGGTALTCSDMFFGDMQSTLLPGPAENMAGGWETRRRRGPGEDWLVIGFARPGRVNRLVVDTDFFMGNYPDEVIVECIYWPDAPLLDLLSSENWHPLLAATKVGPGQPHEFVDELLYAGPMTHLRVRVLPDGGISRIRAHGRPESGSPSLDAAAARLDGTSEQDTVGLLMRCCGSRSWADAMLARRPFREGLSLSCEAEAVWWQLEKEDWLEAFGQHPRIGGDLEVLRERFAQTHEWAASEQAGMAKANEEVIRNLAQENIDYEKRFGHVFLICATGKTADEMLTALQARKGNAKEKELRIAAAEQAKITRIRLEKLSI
jgi:allantoicase